MADDTDRLVQTLRTCTFDEVLEDLSCRFIVNLPANELASIERIGFQVEQAHWFYLDFLAPHNRQLPQLTLRKFSSKLLHVSSLVVPLIRVYTSSGGRQSLEAAYSQFIQYKTRVPVCGAIILSEDWSKCVLVKGWRQNASWTFPKGKINQAESERDCAVREVLEETGFDCGPYLPADSRDFLEVSTREQKVRLYVVPGVKEDTHLEPRTRHEISRIEWFNIAELRSAARNKRASSELGGKMYLVSSFIWRLDQWIRANRRKHPRKPVVRAKPKPQPAEGASVSLDEIFGKPEPEAQAAPAPAPPPAPAPAQPNSRQVLLQLLHGATVPAPTAQDERMDGSAALRKLLGLGPEKGAAPPAPAPPAASVPPANQQQSLLSILSGGKPGASPGASPAPAPAPMPAYARPPPHPMSMIPPPGAGAGPLPAAGPPPGAHPPVVQLPPMVAHNWFASVAGPSGAHGAPRPAAAPRPAVPARPQDEEARRSLLSTLNSGPRPRSGAPSAPLPAGPSPAARPAPAPSAPHSAPAATQPPSGAATPAQAAPPPPPLSPPQTASPRSPPAPGQQQALLSTLLGHSGPSPAPAPAAATSPPAGAAQPAVGSPAAAAQLLASLNGPRQAEPRAGPRGEPPAESRGERAGSPADSLLSILNRPAASPPQANDPKAASNALLSTLLHGK